MSIIAAAVKHMLAAGMAPDAIVAAVEDMESGSPAFRTARQERNHRHYMRLKASEKRLSQTDSDVSDAEQRGPSPTPLTQETNNPPRSPTGIIPPKSRGTRLPTGWHPDAEQIDWAKQELGFSDAEIKFNTEEFRDFWLSQPGAKGCKLDWGRTWKNRMREMTRRGRQRSPPPRGSPRVSVFDALDNLQRKLGMHDERPGEIVELRARG